MFHVLENACNNSSTDSLGDTQPVPPPRLKRKAKKTKKAKSEALKREKERKSQEAKKEDFGWYSSSPKFGIPPVPTLTGTYQLNFCH